MTIYDDGFYLFVYQSGDIFVDNGFFEDSVIQDISDGVVWRFLYLFQFEFFNFFFVRGDGSIFDIYVVFFYGFCGIFSDLVIGGISIFYV